MADVIKEFLVSLGFKIDDVQYPKVTGSRRFRGGDDQGILRFCGKCREGQPKIRESIMKLPFFDPMLGYLERRGSEAMAGKRKVKARAQRQSQRDAQMVIQTGLTKNPEVRLVLEIAQRARELDATVVPVSMEPSGDWRATSFISISVPMS